MRRRGELEWDEAAREAAGHWQRFSCFVWFREEELQDAANWAVVYTHHRDSGLIDQSNAAVIQKAMIPFSTGDDPDAVFESHSHWAVESIDGFSVRVFHEGQITTAFCTYYERSKRMAGFLILDEDDYSRREDAATFHNVGEAAWRLKKQYQMPDEWQSAVYDWLSERRSHALENRDDQGGWPREADLIAAFFSLGYPLIP